MPGQPGLRLRTLADVFAYAAAEGVQLRIDGTEVQVRRPAAEPARAAGVRVRQEEAEHRSSPPPSATAQGRLLWLGAFRPGRMHDVTALRTEGIEDLLRSHPEVTRRGRLPGYQGLARDFPARSAPRPRNPARTPRPTDTARWEAARNQQSSRRICVEHAIAEPKQWRPLQRYLGRRDHFEDTALAIAGLVSDRAAAR